MSRRYIDADKLKEECYKFTNDVSRSAMAFVQGQINAAPTADVVEVVHAYWKETTHITISPNFREIHSKLYNCSNCDAPNGRKKSSYCHWCGAKMDGKRSEE